MGDPQTAKGDSLSGVYEYLTTFGELSYLGRGGVQAAQVPDPLGVSKGCSFIQQSGSLGICH